MRARSARAAGARSPPLLTRRSPAASRRRKRMRNKEEEAEAYLPRLGCHYSLPEGKVACRLHEELRLSGLVENDPGPDVSD